MARPADESRHAAGDNPRWNETWYFDVVAPGGAWGLYAQLTLLPNVNRAWWWSAIVRAGGPVLLVHDDSLALPRAGAFEVRGDGLWADLHCHDAMTRWQVNFEGIAVALDDPEEAYRTERGDRVPVEFEFEWEAEPTWIDTPKGYTQRCGVAGEAAIGGADSLALSAPAPGWRWREWDLRDWWNTPRVRFEGRDVDPATFTAQAELVAGVKVDGSIVERATTSVGWVEYVAVTR